MSLTKPKAIMRLYNETLKNGLTVDENEKIVNIIQMCEKDGKYIFHGDSYWCFVNTINKEKPCVRMIFSLKENEGGKVQNIDRIIDLIKNIEGVLLFIDNIDIIRSDKFIYLDIIKNINE